MNCKECREKILESLAVDAPTYTPEVSSHHEACPACREFLETQDLLFRSIDAGLHLIANPQVPASLLPGLRVLLSQHPASVAWIPRFAFAAIFAVAVLAIDVGYQLRRHAALPNSGQETQVASRGVGGSISVAQALPKSVPVVARRRGKRFLPATSSQLSAGAEPEVIVLPEERQAFARFLAKLPEEKDVALALTRPATVVPDVPIETALLQIETLEVKPLAVAPRE